MTAVGIVAIDLGGAHVAGLSRALHHRWSPLRRVALAADLPQLCFLVRRVPLEPEQFGWARAAVRTTARERIMATVRAREAQI